MLYRKNSYKEINKIYVRNEKIKYLSLIIK